MKFEPTSKKIIVVYYDLDCEDLCKDEFDTKEQAKIFIDENLGDFCWYAVKGDNLEIDFET